MGGVICRTDTSTEMPGLFVAGEDAGGIHGANRLGGNGVANSTVFGGIAGETMARWVRANPGHRAPDESVIEAETAQALHPFTGKPGDLNRLRERLLDIMWEDVGVIREHAGLDRALDALDDLETELMASGLSGSGRVFNLTWHDWLNLRSLTDTSRVIALAARQRENSRGAHFRADFPEPGELAQSTYTVARGKNGQVAVSEAPVQIHHRSAGRHADQGSDRARALRSPSPRAAKRKRS
jgi:fumarate reductase flavoprotein subunit